MEEKRRGRISLLTSAADEEYATRAAYDLGREKLTLLHSVRKVALTSFLFVVVSALSAPAVELFRYRYHAEDGREFEYCSRSTKRARQKTLSEEARNLEQGQIPHWLCCFSDTI
jgi:hypothetical protein